MRQTAKTFKPRPDQINAAKLVFAAMAITQTIRPIVEGYQRAILEAHQWPTAAKWTELKGRPIEQKPITDPAHAYLLEDDDFAEYLRLCGIAQAEAKLTTRRPENCPLLESESDLVDAENAFIRLTSEPLAGIEADRLFSASMDIRREYLNLTLRLFARYI